VTAADFEWAQGLLRGVLIDMTGRLPAEAIDQLGELVDAGELPLCLTVLLQSLEHHVVVVTVDERQRLSTLATRMGVSSEFLE
jgi:hypothetical protein